MPNFARIVAGYFEEGYCFWKIVPETILSPENPKVAFLIHGWGVRSVSMDDLAYALTNSNFTVFNYDYPTSKKNIEEHSGIFLDLYRQTLQQERIEGKVYFLTHSMGGILLRSAMARMSEAECRKIEAIVMLGPPNRGSKLADIGKNAVVRSINASLENMATDANAYVRKIPVPPFLPPVGIIAGKYDGKVALHNTLLPEGQICQRIIVNCTHPGLRNPKHTIAPILHFFQHKTFE